MVEETVQAKKCTQCGTITHPTKVRCFMCRGTTFDLVTCRPAGTVISFTNCTALPDRLGGRKCQGFAIVQLQAGWNVLGQVADPGKIAIGDAVRGTWKEISTNRDGTPAFGWIFEV